MVVANYIGRKYKKKSLKASTLSYNVNDGATIYHINASRYPENLLGTDRNCHRAAQNIEIIRQSVQVYQHIGIDLMLGGGTQRGTCGTSRYVRLRPEL